MNEQAVQLLRDLATKLGTTTEYLWSVLLKQAPIAAVTELIQVAMVVIATRLFWKLHKKFLKEESYDEFELLPTMPMIIGALTLAVLWGVILLVSVPNIINGFFNPEYWALNEVLRAIKK